MAYNEAIAKRIDELVKSKKGFTKKERLGFEPRGLSVLNTINSELTAKPFDVIREHLIYNKVNSRFAKPGESLSEN